MDLYSYQYYHFSLRGMLKPELLFFKHEISVHYLWHSSTILMSGEWMENVTVHGKTNKKVMTRARYFSTVAKQKKFSLTRECRVVMHASLKFFVSWCTWWWCYTKQKEHVSKIEHRVKDMEWVKLHDSYTNTHAESEVHHATLKAEWRPTDLRK